MTADQLIERLDESRKWFLKALDGLKDGQWNAKPYPNVMSIRETLSHLVIDDRCFPDLLQGKEPDYPSYAPDEIMSAGDLLALMEQTHRQKLEWLRGFLAGKDLEGQIPTVYSGKQSLWWEVLCIAMEDWYHIGQVSLIRQGTDPDWDYYAHFYSA